MLDRPWGGSEELWSRAAAALLEQGHYVSVNYNRCKQPVSPLERLRALGSDLYWRSGSRDARQFHKVLSKFHIAQNPSLKWLKRCRPDFLLVSAGHHLDDLSISRSCLSLGIPYGLLVQAASPHQWVEPHRFDAHRAAFAGATRCFFVSQQNREVLESNLALDLSDSEIVDNSFQVSTDARPAWPASEKTWKLACVARLCFQAKSQDLLLRVIRQPKWRSRPLQITLFGDDGGSQRQAQELISLHGQQRQIVLGGFSNDIEQVWREHHALVLPSRFEGNSLAMIEAMLCGRMPIVTDVGRVSELVDDNRSGFIAPAATAELIDDGLERAWQRRHEWQQMGAIAAADIRHRHSLRPADDFAEAILAAIPGQQSTYLRAAA